jgi:hypothetical protein
MLNTALTLARKGLAVMPCRPHDKRPATAHGCGDATTEPQAIRKWWQEEPKYNIAIATGAVSKIFVVDIDGLDAEFELRRLEAEHGALPQSVEAITARGRHVYFRWPETPVRNSAGRIAPGIDVRGDGGYVLAPPSVHPTGRAYCWSVDSASAFATAPQWLLERITANGGNGTTLATPPAAWRELAGTGVDEGKRNTSLARLAGYLLRRHVDVMVAMEMLRCWNAARCRPPLSDDEVVAVINSISGRELRRRGAG